MILDFFLKILSWYANLNKTDWILLITFFSIVWYSVETRRLREWQQKGVQISILDLRQRTLMHQDEMNSKHASSNNNLWNIDTINMANDILEEGSFDFKKLFTPGIINEKKSFISKYKIKIINFLKNK